MKLKKLFKKERRNQISCSHKYINSKAKKYRSRDHLQLDFKKNINDKINCIKYDVALCRDCIPDYIQYIFTHRGYCQHCGERRVLMDIKNYYDEIDLEYYHDIGGEA